MPEETELLSIRFVGEPLRTVGVTIYDLSESLTAIQRIIHKAHLSNTGELSRYRLPTKNERALLALRLGTRRRNSDEFGLTAILTDPFLLNFYGALAANLIAGVTLYALQRGLDTRDTPTAPPTVFNIAIYNQVASLTNRIEGAGGVQSIEIKNSLAPATPPVALDSHTRAYVRGLKNTLVRGERRRLEGRLKHLDPNRLVVGLTDGHSEIECTLMPHDFRTVRYHGIEKPWLVLEGVPIYKLGVETGFFERFDVYQIVSIEEPRAHDGNTELPLDAATEGEENPPAEE